MRVMQLLPDRWAVVTGGGYSFDIVVDGLEDEEAALSVLSYLEDGARGETVPRSE